MLHVCKYIIAAENGHLPFKFQKIKVGKTDGMLFRLSVITPTRAEMYNLLFTFYCLDFSGTYIYVCQFLSMRILLFSSIFIYSDK